MPKASDDSVTITPPATVNDDQTQKVPSGGGAREREAQVEEKLVSEIVQTSEEIDKRAEKQVQEDLAEAKLSQPAPSIPPDVADSGLVSPQSEAEEVVTKGSVVNIPIAESEFKRVSNLKIGGRVVDNIVLGISSIFGLVAWAGRMIKIAPKHAIKVLFKKEGD